MMEVYIDEFTGATSDPDRPYTDNPKVRRMAYRSYVMQVLFPEVCCSATFIWWVIYLNPKLNMQGMENMCTGQYIIH